ncbi:MAG: phosphoglycerate kinase [Cyanobium sp. MAG06]|nr:phosphoglycerate kinase [Cyanobium sp. MAG06]
MITFENIKNNTVLLRADLNDSIENNILQNTDRIDEAIGTVKELLSRGNKIILISHLSDNNQSLLPVANYISKNINAGEFEFLSSINREEISIYIKNNINPHNNLKIVLLENLRMFDLGVEEKNDMLFGKWLSMLSDIFIFDAFSVAHREHASVVGVSEYITHTLGPIAMREEKMLSNVIKEKDNTLFIIGGAKISTKLSLIENLLDNGGTVYLGGAMANTILYKKNIDIKDSIIEKDIIISDKVLKNKNLIIPEHYT